MDENTKKWNEVTGGLHSSSFHIKMFSPTKTNQDNSLAITGKARVKSPSHIHSPTMVLRVDDTTYYEQIRGPSPPSILSNKVIMTSEFSRSSVEPEHSVNEIEREVKNTLDIIHQSSSNDEFDTSLERECQICFEKINALQAQVCVACNGSFCMTCMRWYIEFKINEGEVSKKKLVCPASYCTRPLTSDLVEAYVAPEHFAKYQHFLSNQQPGIRFCPRAGCCSVIDEPLYSTIRRVKCSSCKKETCMRCGKDFHKLPTCTRNGRRFGRWKKRNNVRACPGCASDIEKQGGCSHMKCFQCDHEFCWGCLRPWETHDENLCIPLAFLRSKNPNYGPIAPVRLVTKTVILGAATVVVVTGAGVAVVVVPSILLYKWAKKSIQRRSRSRNYTNEYDLV